MFEETLGMASYLESSERPVLSTKLLEGDVTSSKIGEGERSLPLPFLPFRAPPESPITTHNTNIEHITPLFFLSSKQKSSG